jgi:hypothetical protein
MTVSMSSGVQEARPDPSRRADVSRFLAAGVAAVVAAASVTGFFVFSHGADQQERTLLQQDASQQAALVSSALSNMVSVVQSLAATAKTNDGSATSFVDQARRLVHRPLSVTLVRAYLAHYVVFAEVGAAFRTGQALDNRQVSAILRAHATVSPEAVANLGNRDRAAFVAGSPLVSSGTVVFLSFRARDLLQTVTATGSVGGDLHEALFGSALPTGVSLIGATRGVPLAGPTASAPVRVGSSTWTLQVDASRPLIGTFASAAAFVVLLAGLCLALSLGVTAALVRRRRVPAPTMATAVVSTAAVPTAVVLTAAVPTAVMPTAVMPTALAPVAGDTSEESSSDETEPAPPVGLDRREAVFVRAPDASGGRRAGQTEGAEALGAVGGPRPDATPADVQMLLTMIGRVTRTVTEQTKALQAIVSSVSEYAAPPVPAPDAIPRGAQPPGDGHPEGASRQRRRGTTVAVLGGLLGAASVVWRGIRLLRRNGIGGDSPSA